MKNILSIIVALFLGFVLAKLLFLVFSWTLKAMFVLFFGFMVAVFALPLYFYIKKALSSK
ncbi:MAG TPA: hypothetical protein PLE30_07895 [Candidatus Kapabacteria bacterium]|nr:hypothetical protein [Candidatus Kapabacteria bacterium]